MSATGRQRLFGHSQEIPPIDAIIPLASVTVFELWLARQPGLESGACGNLFSRRERREDAATLSESQTNTGRPGVMFYRERQETVRDRAKG